MRAELKCDANRPRAEISIYFGAGEHEAIREAEVFLKKSNLTASLAQFATIVEREDKFAGIRMEVISLYQFSRRMERGRVSVSSSNGKAAEAEGEFTKKFTFSF